MARPSSFDELLGQLNSELYGVGRNGNNGSNGQKFCDCDETLDSKGKRKRQPMPKWHDCDYCRKRASLVPTAEEIATELGNGDPYTWTRLFVEAMEELVQRCL